MPRAPASPPDPPAPNPSEDADLPEAVKPIKDKHGRWVMQQLEDGRADDTPPDVTVIKPEQDASGNRWIVNDLHGKVEVILTTAAGWQVSGMYATEDDGRAHLLAFTGQTSE